MGHRDDREALHAKNEALQAELERTRAALAAAQAPRPRTGPRGPSLVDRALSAIAPYRAFFSPTAARGAWSTPRAVIFALVAAAVILFTGLLMHALAPLLDGPVEDGPLAVMFWTLVAWVFVGPALVTWITAAALRAPGSKGGAAAAVGVAAFFVAMAPAAIPMLRDAGRQLALGRTRGSVTEASASTAAWARVEPAFLRSELALSSTYARMEGGRMVSSSVWCAPVAASLVDPGPYALFACSSDPASLVAGPGMVEGRLSPLGGMEQEAVASLGARRSAGPLLQITPTFGNADVALALSLLAVVLVLGIGVVVGTVAALRIAATK